MERLSQELVGERSRLEVVSRDFKEMETTNISLKQLVHSTQDALSKEQNLVKSFQEQLQDNKVKNFKFSPTSVLLLTAQLFCWYFFLFVFQFCVLGR